MASDSSSGAKNPADFTDGIVTKSNLLCFIPTLTGNAITGYGRTSDGSFFIQVPNGANATYSVNIVFIYI